MSTPLITFTPQAANLFQSSAFVDKTSEGHFIGVFRNATSDNLRLWGRMPPDYGGGDIEFDLHWASLSVNTGAVQWELKLARYNDNGNALTVSPTFGTTKTVTPSPAATTGALKYTTITMTNAEADGVQAGESFWVDLLRNGSAGSDTMTGDAVFTDISVDQV